MNPTRLCYQGAVANALLLACAWAAPNGSVRADEPERRVAAGKVDSVTGTLITREAKAKAWKFVQPKAEVHTTDVLLALPGSWAEITPAKGAVRISLVGSTPDV